MCGIFGFTRIEQPGLLQRMGDVIRHRGPDGEGFFEDPDAGFSMGMRRLSIIDLQGGFQPIYNEDRSIAICYNGEIYNYIELAEELAARGHVFATKCDTEVIVHAYEEWGMDCLQRFNGMFAFCLYDKNQQRLFFARDRAGQKPFYYWFNDGRLIFASEIKAILKADCVERQCNRDAIDSYLGLRYVPQPETLFEGIYVLPSAHAMTLDLRTNDLRQFRYWDLDLTRKPKGGEPYYLERLEANFEEALRLIVRSDVPVGAYLSGGVDSSLVVAMMAQKTSRLNTFSIGFNSPVDETAQAKELAGILGTTHHEINITPDDFDKLPDCIWHLERPIGDALILAYYFLAQTTSQHVKVVQSGEGADEDFAGYSFHKIILWTERYRRLVPKMLNQGIVTPLLNAVPVELLDKLFSYPAFLGEKGKAKTVDYLRHFHTRNLNESYVALKALWDLPERENIYAGEMRGLATNDWIKRPRDRRGGFLNRLLKLQFDDWLQDNLLLRQDKNTMAHSIELRCPFLDHNIMELAFEMPGHLKVNRLTDKYIERKLAAKVLPKRNVKRSKVPFYFPVEFFYENPKVNELIRMTLDPARVKKRGYFDPAAVTQLVSEMQNREFLIVKQVMSLVILELWHMIFIDREFGFE